MTTHCNVLWRSPRSCCIAGSATFTIAMSRTTMNWAMHTKIRIKPFRVPLEFITPPETTRILGKRCPPPFPRCPREGRPVMHWNSQRGKRACVCRHLTVERGRQPEPAEQIGIGEPHERRNRLTSDSQHQQRMGPENAGVPGTVVDA